MSRLPALTILLLLRVTGVFGQMCSVDGIVVNSVTNAPIVRAQVNIAGADDTSTAVSGTDGKWKAEHLPCGRITIGASRVGFLRSQQSLLMMPDSPLHDIKLTLAPQAVIAGRVVDDQGDPIFGAEVGLLTSHIQNGVRSFQQITAIRTNDLGEYRFAELAAGKYIACVNAGYSNGPISLGERCYPGSPDAGIASAMSIVASSEARVDFALSRVTTFRVSGVISGQQELSNVNLFPPFQNGRVFLNLSTTARPDGTFSIGRVPPGSYILVARSRAENTRLEARIPVDVAANDVAEVRLRLESGVTVSGTVRAVSATGRKIEKPEYTASLISAELGGAQQGPIWGENRSSFKLPEMLPGNYRLDFYAPPPFYVKSATLGGRDIATSELPIGPGVGVIEVVISDDGGAVEGITSTDDGPVPAWVYLERDGKPSRNSRTDANGHFKIDTVAPGDYKIYAWEDNTNVEYANPDWMKQNAKGVAVTVAPGQTVQVKLTRQTAPVE